MPVQHAHTTGGTLGDFQELGLHEQTLRGLTEMGFEESTPIQAQAIPLLMAGRDLVAQALTGTGKTAAFGVPIVERIDLSRKVPQVIVLTPTRELAVQVTDQLGKIGRYHGLAAIPIYGGQPIERQLQTLRRGVHVIVATPGRLLDHLRRGTVDLSTISMIVLDEADQMLDMGFIEDIEYVLGLLPKERVMALFSATMPAPIIALARRVMRDPEIMQLSRPQGLTVPEIEQVFYVVPFPRKQDALCRVLDAKRPVRTMVFCATKRTVDDVVEGLQARGYLADGLHGDMSQALREKVLRAFRAGRIEVMVATDVAARGLDVPEVSHVVNFDIPPDPEYYVHRIGRTGRLGRRGEAITFVNPREQREIQIIERVTGARIRREEVPTVAEVEEREAQALEERLLASLSGSSWGKYRPMIEELADEHDPIDIAAAALALIAGGRGADAPRPAAPNPSPHNERSEPVRERWSDRSERPNRTDRSESTQPRAERGHDGSPRPPRRSEGTGPTEDRPAFARKTSWGRKPGGDGPRKPRPATGGGPKPHRKGPSPKNRKRP